MQMPCARSQEMVASHELGIVKKQVLVVTSDWIDSINEQ